MHDGGSRIEPHLNPADEPHSGSRFETIAAPARAPLSDTGGREDTFVVLGLTAMVIVGAGAIVAAFLL